MYDIKYRDILYNDKQIGPFPSDKLKRVPEPTTAVNLGPHESRKWGDLNPEIVPRANRGDFGPDMMDPAKREEAQKVFTITEPIGAALTSVQRHLNEIRRNPVAEKKAPIPDDPRVLSRHIKSLGYFLGADQVGIGHPPDWAYYTVDHRGNEVPERYKYCITLLCRKNITTTRVSDGVEWIFDPVSFQTYQRLCAQTETMANYIRRLGYEADATNMFNYKTMMMPLILFSGLGEACKTHSYLNPFLGINMKSAAVLTDMPLEIDGFIDFGLQEYCASCTICEEVCPLCAQQEETAIKGRKHVFNGYETWEIDTAVCSIASKKNKRGQAKGRCTKVCPWGFETEHPAKTKEWWDNWDGSIEKLHARVRANGEELRKKGFVNDGELTQKWWFDLKRVSSQDRTLIIPDTTEQVSADYYSPENLKARGTLD